MYRFLKIAKSFFVRGKLEYIKIVYNTVLITNVIFTNNFHFFKHNLCYLMLISENFVKLSTTFT